MPSTDPVVCPDPRWGSGGFPHLGKDFLDLPVNQRHTFAYSGRLISFDQSLAHTGWVYLEVEGHTATLMACGQRDSQISLKGHLASIERSASLCSEMEGVLRTICGPKDPVIYEIPPVANRVQRPESSLLAAAALYWAAGNVRRIQPFRVYGVSAQKSKKIWTSNPNASKKLVREALFRWDPALKERNNKLSEHQIDALANGLAWAEIYSAADIEE